MAKYKLFSAGVLRDDGAQIPASENNRDWREYLEWQAVGNVPDPADAILPRETSLSPSHQIILADGEDLASVLINGEPGTQVNYTVNSELQSATLDSNGNETIELTCDTPNTTLLVVAGNSRAVIFVVEVPS